MGRQRVGCHKYRESFYCHPISSFFQLYPTLATLGKAALPVSLVRPGSSGILMARNCQLGPESPEMAPAWLHFPAAIGKEIGWNTDR